MDKLIVWRGDEALAVMHMQPKPVLSVWQKLQDDAELGAKLQVFSVSPDKLGDERVTNLTLRAIVDKVVIGIRFSFTLGADLQAALSPRNNHGKPLQTKQHLPVVNRFARALIDEDCWCVYFQSGGKSERGSQLTLVRGRASQTPDEPFGIKLSFDTGTWLAGYPGDFHP
ncbi:MAG: hypothetical protein K2W82_17830 [Candidatus Obscuribacterales bacterium]|nr:hypothetical protein [Candidatus Obscuribacterales bacterium]